MKKFDLDNFLEICKNIKNEEVVLSKKQYYDLANCAKRAVRKAGLCIRRQMIAKNKNIKFPCLIFPVNIVTVDDYGKKYIYLQLVFLNFKETISGSFVCSARQFAFDKQKQRYYIHTFCLNKADKEIKDIKKININIKVKDNEFMKLLCSLLDEFGPYIPNKLITNKIGWYQEMGAFKYYPISNPSITSNDDSSLFLVYPDVFKRLSYFQEHPFLRKEYGYDLHSQFVYEKMVTSIDKMSNTDIVLFASTLFSFCRKFFMNNNDYNPFSCFIYSQKKNSVAWEWVSFWVDLFNPVGATRIGKHELIDDLIGYGPTGKDLPNRFLDKRRDPSTYSHIKSKNFIKPHSIHSTKSLNRTVCRDCPVIINNPKPVANTERPLISNKMIEKYDSCDMLPIIIRPDNSEFLPSSDNFILSDYEETIIDSRRNPSLTSDSKEFLLHVYKNFIVFLNANSSSINKKLSEAYKTALKDLIENGISISKPIKNYAHLLATLYVFRESITTSANSNMFETVDLLIQKAKSDFKDQITKIDDLQPKIITPELCLQLFKDFIDKATYNSFIANESNLLSSVTFGWYENREGIKNLYLKKEYFIQYRNYCCDKGFVLNFTQKGFEKHVLAARSILIPQYIPSSPDINQRYDVLRKINGIKVKTIRIETSMLSKY